MRQQVPRFQKDPPPSRREKLEAKWYASVQQQNSQRSELHDRDSFESSVNSKQQQQQRERPVTRMVNYDRRQTGGQQEQPLSPTSLGQMLVENQMAMDHAMKHNGVDGAFYSSREEQIAALAAARNNIHTPSISSTQDMERARRTVMDDERRNDSSTLPPSWRPPEVDPLFDLDEFTMFDTGMEEDREPPPPTRYSIESSKSSHRPHRVFEEDTTQGSSAFENIRPLRLAGQSGIIPTPALADAESMVSPAAGDPLSPSSGNFFPVQSTMKIANDMRYEPTPHFRGSNLKVNNPENVARAVTNHSAARSGSMFETNSIIEPDQSHSNMMATTYPPTGSILEFIRNPCAGVSAPVWKNNNDNEDHTSSCQKDNTNNNSTFWSYLDPNDDLVYYDDAEDADSVSSSERAPRGQRKTTRSPKKSIRSPKKVRAPKTPTRTKESSPRTVAREDQLNGQTTPDSIRRTYKDILSYINSERSVNPETPGRQSPRTPRLASNDVYAETKELQYNRSVTPTRESMLADRARRRSLSRSPSPGKTTRRSKSPDPRMPPREKTPDKRQHNVKKKSSPRVRVTVTSNIPQSSKQRDRQKPSATTPSRAKQRGAVESSMHEEPTPRASNKDGYETTAAFVSARGAQQANPAFNFDTEPNNSNNTSKNATRQRSSTPQKSRNDRANYNSTTPNARQGKSKHVTMAETQDDGFGNGIFPFKPDLYMLEALGKEIVGGVAPGLTTHDGFPSIEVNDKIEHEVSNLSSDESSGMSSDTRRLKEKLNQVRNRSLRNLQRLQQLQSSNTNRIPEQLKQPPPVATRQMIPDQLPQSPRKEQWDAFPENASTAAIDYANCFDPRDCGPAGFVMGDFQQQKQQRAISHPANPQNKSRNVGRGNITSGTSTTSSTTASSYSSLSISQTNEIKRDENVPQTEFEGHYMYIAYSRFGEDPKEVLQLCEHQNLPVPENKKSEVLVKVMASTVTMIDCEIRRGEWSDVRLSPYIIPGITFVGKIDASEKKSAFSSFKPGDTVMSLVKSGSNARYMCVAKTELVKVPSAVDVSRAACLPETYLTAFQVLHMNHRYASVRYRPDSLKGQSILVMNGHSSLGRAIIELSLAAGADFCYALVKSKQTDAVSKLGGIPLSKDPQDWLTLIGRQIHLLVTVIDGLTMYSDHVTKDHLKALNKDGEVVIVGQRGVDNSNNVVSNPQSSSKQSSRLICKSHKIEDRTKSYNVFDSWESDKKQCKRDLEYLLKLLGDGRIKPSILEKIPLSKIGKAQAIVETKKLSGHIVCEPWLPQTYVPR